MQSPVEHPNNELSESLLWPLNIFYSRFAREMPNITPLFGQHLPEPYHQLLVHERNMTPTLEDYFNSNLYVEPLHVLATNHETTREIILRTEEEDQAVEYGASRIFWDTINTEARQLIQAGRIPLGTILLNCNCEHTVEPAGFFKIKTTPFFVETLKLTENMWLYGRRNRLVAKDGTCLAEVCEVLPPIENNS